MSDRKSHPLSESELAARRENAKRHQQKSQAEKVARALRSLAAEPYGEARWSAMMALQENPLEFEKLRASLIDSHRPANGAQRAAVERLAWLRWQQKRNQSAFEGLMVSNVEALKLDRDRKAQELEAKYNYNAPHEEVMEKGLLNLPDSHAKFEQARLYLEIMVDQAEQGDFDAAPENLWNLIYGKAAPLHALSIRAGFRELATAARKAKAESAASGFRLQAAGGEGGALPGQPGGESAAKTPAVSPPRLDPECEDDRKRLVCDLHEEIRDITARYLLYLDEHVKISPARWKSCLAVSGKEARLLVRAQSALGREIERETKVLLAMQKAQRETATASPAGGDSSPAVDAAAGEPSDVRAGDARAGSAATRYQPARRPQTAPTEPVTEGNTP